MKKAKHFLGVLLPLCLALGIISGTAFAASGTQFTDVAPGIWYADPVDWAIDQGITNGTTSTTFSPDSTCTNAQVLTFIWRACGEPEPTISNPFYDVTADQYYYKPALWAYEHDMVTGSNFQADKPCTRSMAVTYLWKELECPEVAPDSRFTDVSASADYAQAVAWAVKVGITDGTGDSTFSPNTTCTRAHIITFLYRDWDGGSIVDFGSNDDNQSELEIPFEFDSSNASILPESNSDADFDSDSSTNYIEIKP